MSNGQSSVSVWVEQLRAGDKGLPVEKLWERYFERLVVVARNNLGKLPRCVSDEEDVALSAFGSFCEGALRGRFPKLNDRTDLHITRLQESVTWGNATATETLNMFMQKFQGLGDATLMAMKQLSQLVHRQAVVMGFGDAFLMLTLFYLGLSLLVTLLDRPPSPFGSSGDAH